MKIILAAIIMLTVSFIISGSLSAQVLSSATVEKLERQQEQQINMPMDKNIEDSIRKPQSQIYFSADANRDPFKDLLPAKETVVAGAATKGAQLPNFTVTGIIWGGAAPQAIINAKVVSIGDTLEGGKITDITKEGVAITFNDKIYILTTGSYTGKDSANKQ